MLSFISITFPDTFPHANMVPSEVGIRGASPLFYLNRIFSSNGCETRILKPKEDVAL